MILLSSFAGHSAEIAAFAVGNQTLELTLDAVESLRGKAVGEEKTIQMIDFMLKTATEQTAALALNKGTVKQLRLEGDTGGTHYGSVNFRN